MTGRHQHLEDDRLNECWEKWYKGEGMKSRSIQKLINKIWDNYNIDKLTLKDILLYLNKLLDSIRCLAQLNTSICDSNNRNKAELHSENNIDDYNEGSNLDTEQTPSSLRLLNHLNFLCHLFLLTTHYMNHLNCISHPF